VDASRSWAIDLAAWIVQDGNYPDFEQGQTAEFALEFWPIGELESTGPGLRFARRLSDATYDVCGEVIAGAAGWWVIDIGDLQVFRNAAPSGVTVGSWVRGTIGLGVDPFFYFERLHQIDGIPPLVYTWSVDEIQLQTAPFIRVDNALVRDANRWAWRTVDRTHASTDDDGNGSYLLSCSLTSVAPKRSSTTAT